MAGLIEKAVLSGRGASFRYVAWDRTRETVWPILGALSAADRALSAGKGRKENTVIISLGLGDVRALTPELDYERMLDVLIDRVRRHIPGARIMLVGPPPEVARTVRSERYAAITARVAGEHHVKFVDLHARFTRQSDWERFYREAESPSVYYTYPLAEGRRRAAEWVAGALRP